MCNIGWFQIFSNPTPLNLVRGLYPWTALVTFAVGLSYLCDGSSNIVIKQSIYVFTKCLISEISDSEALRYSVRYHSPVGNSGF